jgi:hypothetical protein
LTWAKEARHTTAENSALIGGKEQCPNATLRKPKEVIVAVPSEKLKQELPPPPFYQQSKRRPHDEKLTDGNWAVRCKARRFEHSVFCFYPYLEK